MKEWFLGRSPREQQALVIGTGLLLILLGWALLWQPLADRVQRLEAQLAEQRQQQAWMRQAAAEVKRLRQAGGGRTVTGLGGRSLLAVVDQSARSAGLGTGLKRVEPEGSGRVRLRLEDVPFDALVRWLAQAGRQFGIRVHAISVERAKAAGRVDVRLTLDAGAS
ncbi:type II secretion system protein M [Thiohalobacter sp. IOR34]|uniref:type II secretion system protein M n=1 Tax=Thiohalobacter sp. IOR34 TaxID=3057176 RepID=UPI0025B0BCCA|nr:type II secretion system protein M [Thiohalobacter sp. IOR34]WJW75222.1 type II secretion system protein M [Thiohalobacter sp. IOR34]